MDSELLQRLNIARQSRKAVAVVTHLADGQKRLVVEDDIAGDPLAEQITQRLRSGKSGIVETAAGEIFIQMYVPPPRLVIIGAVHISQALYPMAQACGFDVTIIDPRTAFATPERFQNVVCHAEWPEEVLKRQPLDAFTALAVVTHDPKIDDFPLMAALDAGCFYVGALGGRKTNAKRVDRLSATGVDGVDLDRICAPIGLDIGAANPAEIAVAVLAQIVEALRKPNVALASEQAA